MTAFSEATKALDETVLVLRIEGGEEHRGVGAYNPLPLEGSPRFVCFADRKGRELAMVRVDETLTESARAIIEEALNKRYMRAVIGLVLSVEVEGRTS